MGLNPVQAQIFSTALFSIVEDMNDHGNLRPKLKQL